MIWEIRDIAHAGRGVIATEGIPAGTLLLNSGPPAFHLIFKTYGKETCATCFFWDRGRTLPVRDNDVAKVFCSTACQSQWIEEQAEIGVEAWTRLTTFLRAKTKILTNTDETMGDGPKPDVDHIAAAWRDAEQDSKLLQQRLQPEGPKTKAEKKSIRAVEERIGKAVDSNMLSYLLCATLFRHRHPLEWHEVRNLALDDVPYKHRKDLDAGCNSFLQLTTILPPELLSSLTPELCRTVVQADNHNAFGIRSGGEDSEEYMGYGVYPSASYFNHSCSPNVNKSRHGRVWEFRSSRDIAPGTELCITYLGGDEKDLSLSERQSRLKDVWEFDCCCTRCLAETAT